MRLPLIPFTVKAESAARLCALALLVALAAACELDGASKRRAEEARDSAAGQTARAPQTSVPLPPAETAGQTNARAGGWTYLDGRRGGLEDLRGQAVVLDFYATYCPPCLEEIPHLVKLQRRHGPQGFKVIGLNVGGPEDQAKVPDFVRQLGIQYPLANPDDSLVQSFFAGESAIPQTFVFDREGRLVEHFVGYSGDIAARLERAVEAALASKAAAAE
ncbi:MAG TPA: TlpA disulfide reductase family protein [Pyrinomonadaceae bacterium]|nr:TlpA disulfide reductase family protein [Pyrinomonadaceae bacterium]